LILHKLTSAIRRQDWFQVMIEVLIVIVGIFLGLQVQAWYVEQQERELESLYLTELHDDVAEVLQSAAVRLDGLNYRNETLKNIINNYIENGEFAEISEMQCNAIILSNALATFISPLVSLDEIDSSGMSLLIQNKELRRMLTHYRLQNSQTTREFNQMFSVGHVLSDQYPTIIDLKSDMYGLDIKSMEGNTCFKKNIAEHPDFGNKLVSNANYHDIYTILMNLQFNLLEKIHVVIDKEINIIHKVDAK